MESKSLRQVALFKTSKAFNIVGIGQLLTTLVQVNISQMKVSCAILCICCLQLFSLRLSAQQPSFNTYNVSLYKGKLAPLKLKGNKLATQYRTGIRDTYYSTKDQVEYHGLTGLNFAGHYCFVYLGCGSDCQLSFVVDLKTGIVHPGIDAGRGYQFKPNSKLLIVNPPNEGPPSSIFKTEYYVWDELTMRLAKVK